MIYLGSQKRLTSFWLGRVCVFCLSRKVNKTERGYIKCRRCGKCKSLKRLRRELGVVLGFIDQRPARQIALELERIATATGAAVGIGYPYPVTIERVSAWIRALSGKDVVVAPISALASTDPVN